MRDNLIELIVNGENELFRQRNYFTDMERIEHTADYLIANGVTLATDICVGDKKPLTIAERADLERIRISIKQKCLDMAQPGMWERYTKNMECGEIREFAQYYRDMELVYKLITGFALPWPPKECE